MNRWDKREESKSASSTDYVAMPREIRASKECEKGAGLALFYRGHYILNDNGPAASITNDSFPYPILFIQTSTEYYTRTTEQGKLGFLTYGYRIQVQANQNPDIRVYQSSILFLSLSLGFNPAFNRLYKLERLFIKL